MSTLPAHSPWGASSYYRWKACPGSVNKCRGLTSESTSYAQTGTLAHDMAAKLLESPSYTFSNRPDGLDEDDVAAVLTYCEHVKGIRVENPQAQVFIETRFDLSELQPGLFGTADCVIYDPVSKRLTVIDYKHGQGIPVEVEHNSQLMYYGLGALHCYKFPVERVVLCIVQPRCFHPGGAIREWELSPLDLLDFAADLVDDAKKTLEPDAPIQPGPHCRFCPAQPTCPAVHDKALAVARQVFSPTTSYDPAKLTEALAALPMMEGWMKAVREFAYREAQAGRTPPGWKLVAKRARRKWRPGVTRDELAQAFGEPSRFFEEKLKSPAQVEKTLFKADCERLNEFVLTESSGFTLVESTDNRAEIPDAIESAFGVIDE